MQELPIQSVYEGWDGYNQSVIHAVEPLTAEQLAWRPTWQHRSVGDLVLHIALGRLEWFARMAAPGSDVLAGRIEEWEVDRDGNRHIVDSALAITGDKADLIRWLDDTWQMIDLTLTSWSVADLRTSFRYTFNGQLYDIPRQWVIWRIMAHDIHHGGELSLMLGMQGIEAFELSALGGHIIMPPLADEHR
jgi:uncharacterized damage-inducible protein DinB